MAHKKWSAVVFIIGPSGYIPLVRDQKFAKRDRPVWWKLPGGGRRDLDEILSIYPEEADVEPDHSPRDTAKRELREETGLFSDTPLRCIGKEKKGKHTLFYYSGTVRSFRDMLKVGNEGEEVGIFSMEELSEMYNNNEFHPNHYAQLKQQSLISDG